MRIQHNIMAMNAYRNYSNNTSALAKNLEKLSSGYKINRAGDDAAGLAISEKMRAQITGLEAAQKNVKDGISLVNTAEGAMQEIHDMMNRMVYLAQESANGTFDNEVDRKSLQSEIDQLRSEIDRIADSANFNGIKLLDGSLAGGSGAAVVSAAGNGEMVATVESDIASLKTNQNGTDAQAGKYTVNIAVATTTGGKPGSTDVLKFTVDYVDADGKNQSKTVYAESGVSGVTTSASFATVIANAIKADADLSKLFAVTVGTSQDVDDMKITLTAKQTGTNGAQLKGLNVVGCVKNADRNDDTVDTADTPTSIATTAKLNGLGAQKVEVTQAATDTEKVNVIELAATINGQAVASASAQDFAGKTIKVGDKTYEFVDQYKDTFAVGRGHIAVNAGSDAEATIKNLVEALKANGVTSAVAELGTTANPKYQIKIGDLDQIKTANNNAEITTSNKDGIKITTVTADKSVSQFTVQAGSGNKAQFEVTYIDENGETQKASIGYTSSATAASNASSIVAAFAQNEKLSSLFTIAADTNNVVTITAKNAGADGGSIVSVSTSDNDPDSVRSLRQTTAGRDAGQSISLDVDQMTDGDTLTINGTTFQFVNSDNLDSVKDGNTAVILDKTSQNVTAANLNLALKQKGMGVEFNGSTNSFFIPSGAGKASATGGLTLQIGDSSDSYNQLAVSVKDMHVKAMGIADIDISTQAGAQAAVDVIKNAINYVSEVRGNLGAISNRLDHTANNLSVMRENIQDAESSIRDTDVADEMMAYTKNNILVQSAQAMLAQANQVPQGVLQLLQ